MLRWFSTLRSTKSTWSCRKSKKGATKMGPQGQDDLPAAASHKEEVREDDGGRSAMASISPNGLDALRLEQTHLAEENESLGVRIDELTNTVRNYIKGAHPRWWKDPFLLTVL